MTKSRLLYLRLVLGIFTVLLIGTAHQFGQNLLDLEVAFSPRSEWWLLVLGLYSLGLLSTVLLAATWVGSAPRLLTFVDSVARPLRRSRFVSVLILLIVLIGFPLLIFGSAGITFVELFPRLLIFFPVFLVATLALKGSLPQKSIPFIAATAAISLTLIHQLVILFKAVS